MKPILAVVLALLTTASVAQELKPAWTYRFQAHPTRYQPTGPVRFDADQSAIYISEWDRVTCLDKRSGTPRWSTQLSEEPQGFEGMYGVAARITLADNALCVIRHGGKELVDILHRKTGKLIGTVGYFGRTIQGVLPSGRFALVATTPPNRFDVCQLSALDLEPGATLPEIPPVLMSNLWKPYYALGALIFRREGAKLTLLPTAAEVYRYPPKVAWILPEDRALVSTYDRETYAGEGAAIALWSLKPMKEIWSAGIPADIGGKRLLAWTERVTRAGEHTWLDGVRLEGSVNSAVGTAFLVRGELVGTSGPVLDRIASDGQLTRIGKLPPHGTVFSETFPAGEALLRDCWTDDRHRLELFWIPTRK